MRASALGLIVVLGACSSYSESNPAPTAPDGGDSGPNGVCDLSVLYVSTKGDDANDGCDPQKPRRTVTSAIGFAAAKTGGKVEIRTCAETLQERVVIASASSIIGGFDCNSWKPGAGRTTFQAPPGDVVETMIAFGPTVGPDVRVEHLRIEGPKRATGDVATLRFTGGSSPTLRDVDVEGGTTAAGHSVTVGIEGSSPTIEEGKIAGGAGACSTGCSGVYASAIAINGGRPRLRKMRIEGGSATVTATGNMIGSLALDVAGDVKASGADAWTALDIAGGVGHVDGSYPIMGVRVLPGADVEITDSKLVSNATPSTCKSSTCFSIGAFASGGTLRLRKSAILSLRAAVEPGIVATFLRESAAIAAERGKLDARSTTFYSESGALDVLSDGSMDVAASTIIGAALASTSGGPVAIRSSILAHTKPAQVAFQLIGCPGTAVMSLDTSMIVGSPQTFATFVADSGGTCQGAGAFGSLSATVAASTAKNSFSATNVRRHAGSCAQETTESCLEVAACKPDATGFVTACLGTVFASVTEPTKLKDGVACSIAKGGLVLADVPDDIFGLPRSAPTSMGAHEYDGPCSN